MLVDFSGRADLLDLALVHQHHAVGHFERFFLVVRDEDAGDVQLVVQAPQPAAQLLAHLGVERAERLVQQQHLGLDRQRARQRDALPLSAGELMRIAVGEPVELHQLQQLVHLAPDFRRSRAARARLHAQAEGDVLEHGHVPEQRVVLEHEADLPLAHVLRRTHPRHGTGRCPLSGTSRPAMMRSSVVLPQPDGPSSATSSPGRERRGSRRPAR